MVTELFNYINSQDLNSSNPHFKLWHFREYLNLKSHPSKLKKQTAALKHNNSWYDCSFSYDTNISDSSVPLALSSSASRISHMISCPLSNPASTPHCQGCTGWRGRRGVLEKERKRQDQKIHKEGWEKFVVGYKKHLVIKTHKVKSDQW